MSKKLIWKICDFIQNKATFTVMSLNCQSISSKFEGFKLFINDLMDHHCYVDVIHLQVTWLCDAIITTTLNFLDMICTCNLISAQIMVDYLLTSNHY